MDCGILTKCDKGGYIMNFILEFMKKKQDKATNLSTLSVSHDNDSFNEEFKESKKQYQKHRKSAEEHIKSGARLTRHRIDL